MKRISSFPIALTLGLPSLAGAEDAPAKPRRSVELNATDTVGETCRLTSLLHNEMAADIERFGFETVLFSKEGGVILLTRAVVLYKLWRFSAAHAGRHRAIRTSLKVWDAGDRMTSR